MLYPYYFVLGSTTLGKLSVIWRPFYGHLTRATRSVHIRHVQVGAGTQDMDLKERRALLTPPSSN